jgi:hypothetical protein
VQYTAAVVILYKRVPTVVVRSCADSFFGIGEGFSLSRTSRARIASMESRQAFNGIEGILFMDLVVSMLYQGGGSSGVEEITWLSRDEHACGSQCSYPARQGSLS